MVLVAYPCSRRLRTALVSEALGVIALLCRLGRIDSIEADALAVNFDRVAIDH